MFLKKFIERVVEFMEKSKLDPDRMLLRAEDVSIEFPYFITGVREFDKGLMLQVADIGSPQQLVERINRDLKSLEDDELPITVIYSSDAGITVHISGREER